MPAWFTRVSPVHTDQYYARKIKELVALGADAIFIKDPSGLLTPERAATLIPVAKTACGKLPLQLHSHCLTGLAPYVAIEAVKLGVDVVHTATSTLANGASHPSTEQFIHNIGRQGFATGVDVGVVEQVAEKLRYIAKREKKPLGAIIEHDAFHYEHQMPGGMISNLKSQLASLGISDKLPQILEEAARVRCDLGYPIIVSPFAQFVMTQAVLNVMGKERYATVPDEVRKYVLGITARSPARSNRTSSIASAKAPSRSKRALAICSSRASPVCAASAAPSSLTTICCWPRSTRTPNTKRSKQPGRSRRIIRWRRRHLSRWPRRSRCAPILNPSISSNAARSNGVLCHDATDHHHCCHHRRAAA